MDLGNVIHVHPSYLWKKRMLDSHNFYKNKFTQWYVMLTIVLFFILLIFSSYLHTQINIHVIIWIFFYNTYMDVAFLDKIKRWYICFGDLQFLIVRYECDCLHLIFTVVITKLRIVVVDKILSVSCFMLKGLSKPHCTTTLYRIKKENI